MAFFSRRNHIFSANSDRIKRSKRLGKEQLQFLVTEMGKDLEQGETLLQSLPIGVILLDKDFHLQLMNKAAKRCPLFFPLCSLAGSGVHGTGRGASSPSIEVPVWHSLGHNLRNNLKGQDSATAELARWLEDELQGNSVPQPKEFQSFDYNNQLRVNRIEISSQVYNGKIEGWIILINDVSELRKQERKVQQLDILASLSTVTAGIAHEIKNPLAAMSLHVQLMQRLLSQHKPTAKVPEANSTALHSQLLEYCGIVQEEIEQLNVFITDFLLTVRPLELELCAQSIHQVIPPCLELLQPELQSKGILLELLLAKELPEVALDAVMFKRLLLNLLQNGIQAIEEKRGALEMPHLYCGKLRLQSYHKNDAVYLEICDNGCGMSDTTKKKILEPFFTTRAKGSGLGMTMVLRILQTHNGDLQIQTEEGSGTMMRIALPIFCREQYLLLDHSSNPPQNLCLSTEREKEGIQ